MRVRIHAAPPAVDLMQDTIDLMKTQRQIISLNFSFYTQG